MNIGIRFVAIDDCFYRIAMSKIVNARAKTIIFVTQAYFLRQANIKDLNTVNGQRLALFREKVVISIGLLNENRSVLRIGDKVVIRGRRNG